MRKFADKQTSREQSDGSKTEATLILCGYSGERANNRGDSTIKEEVRRRKMRKFADKQSSKQSDGSKTETTLILCGYSRERANNCTVLHSSVLYCIKRGG